MDINNTDSSMRIWHSAMQDILVYYVYFNHLLRYNLYNGIIGINDYYPLEIDLLILTLGLRESETTFAANYATYIFAKDYKNGPCDHFVRLCQSDHEQ